MKPPCSLPPRLIAPRWPPGWTASPTLPQHSNSDTLPRITVVTPSYNQAAFLETTIRSVLEQGYPALDYHVIDGGSTDGSVEILEHYGPWLASWVSERDGGQVDAILKGLSRAEGEWFNWINSDDLLAPSALWEVARARDVDMYAGCTHNFWQDVLAQRRISRNITARGLVRQQLGSRAIWHQPGIWFRTAALREVGIDRSLHYRFDFDLIIRYARLFPRVQYSDSTLAWFRKHADSKTVSQADRFHAEHVRILQRLIADPQAGALNADARQGLAALQWRQDLRALEQDEGRSRLNRLLAIVLAASHAPCGGQMKFIYKALRGVVRGNNRVLHQ